MNINCERFLGLHNAHKKLIDFEINSFFERNKSLYDDTPFIKKLYYNIWDFCTKDGKKLRPVSMLMAYLGASNLTNNEIYKAAICVELYHSCTLIHDDIIDEDTKRRGNDTIFEIIRKHYTSIKKNKQYNSDLFKSKESKYAISHAIIAGNLLNALSIMSLNNLNFDKEKINRTINILADTANKVNIGQILDIIYENKKDIQESEYLQMINKKTVKLFSSSIQIGLVLANASENQLKNMQKYADHVATSFQLQDDIMDILPKSKKGHETGSDIVQGKMTMLIIKALELSNEFQKNNLIKCIFGEKEKNENVHKAIEILHETGAVDYVKNLARANIEKGKKYLIRAKLKDVSHNYFLLFADYMLNRNI